MVRANPNNSIKNYPKSISECPRTVLCKPPQRSERPRSAKARRQAPREGLATPLPAAAAASPVHSPPAGARLLFHPLPRRGLEATPDGHGTEGRGRPSPAVPRARAADNPEGPEHQRHHACVGGRGRGGGQGEEEQEEEPVRRGAVPAGLGRRLQGRQDHLARRLLPDHQDQPLQGWPAREGVGDSAQGRRASSRCSDKNQRG